MPRKPITDTLGRPGTLSLTPWEAQRRVWCEQGRAVLANHTRDHGLIAWAKQQHRLTRIDRPSRWGNPSRRRRGATIHERVSAIEAYADWLAEQPRLLAALPTLRGRVLLCHCTPLRCHGDVLLWGLELDWYYDHRDAAGRAWRTSQEG